MAKKKDRGAIRRRRKAKVLAAMHGFTSVGADNPFESTPLVENADNETLTRMQRRFNADVRRRNTFAQKPNLSITKGYDATVSILGSALYHQLKEATQLDSYQVIDLIKQFDEDLDATVLEHALSTFIDEFRLPTVVNVESIQEALEAGFDIEEAVEYAELMERDVHIEVNAETVYTDLLAIIQDDLQTVARNNGKV